MTSRTTAEWLYGLQQEGDELDTALEELTEYLYRAVFVYLRHHRSDLSDYGLADLQAMAQDFAQEAALTVYNNLENFRGDAKFTTWAYRFVINEAAGELRRRTYRDRLSLEGLSEQETTLLMSLADAEPDANPELVAERREVLRTVLHIIQTELNERQRLAMLGIYFQGRSMQETAESLNTTPNTLYKMLHDARKRIKKRLQALHLSGGDILASFEE